LAECWFCLREIADGADGEDFCSDDCAGKYADLFGPPPEAALEDLDPGEDLALPLDY